jgi:2-oxoglutarate dehydrogenase E1 component
VIWEAQFGDFANGAQIVIDQFVASGADKWRQRSALVVLLPHGLEGQGPEHSSARLERILQLCARDNMDVAQPSTPASYFHLLRRQIYRSCCKPLIVMAAKSLLRLPAARSALATFGPQTAFEPVIASSGPGPTRTILLCSGKLAYELENERKARNAHYVAILRLELLYPFPTQALLPFVTGSPRARIAWVQEEPRNFGAWTYIREAVERLLIDAGITGQGVACIARPESSSPAGGFHADHERDQKHLTEEAFRWTASGEARVDRKSLDLA